MTRPVSKEEPRARIARLKVHGGGPIGSAVSDDAVLAWLLEPAEPGGLVGEVDLDPGGKLRVQTTSVHKRHAPDAGQTQGSIRANRRERYRILPVGSVPGFP